MDPKSPVAAILLKMKGKPGDGGPPGPDEGPPPDDGDGGDDQGLRMAAEDLIAAVQKGDVEGVMSALHAAFEVCDSYGDDADDAGKE